MLPMPLPVSVPVMVTVSDLLYRLKVMVLKKLLHVLSFILILPVGDMVSLTYTLTVPIAFL